MNSPYALIPAACLLALTCCTAKASIRCPTPQLHHANGELYDTSTDILTEEQRFGAGASENAVREAVASLRKRYPGASNSEIYNYLVAAYCPDAVDAVPGRSMQRSKMQEFEQSLRSVLKL